MSAHFHADDNHINYRPYLYVLLCLATALHLSHTTRLLHVDLFFSTFKMFYQETFFDFVFCISFLRAFEYKKNSLNVVRYHGIAMCLCFQIPLIPV